MITYYSGDPTRDLDELPKTLMPGDALEFRPLYGNSTNGSKRWNFKPAKLTSYANTGHGRFTGTWAKVALELVSAGADDGS